MDQGSIRFYNNASHHFLIGVWAVSDECVTCLPLPIAAVVHATYSSWLPMQTKYGTTFYFNSSIKVEHVNYLNGVVLNPSIAGRDEAALHQIGLLQTKNFGSLHIEPDQHDVYTIEMRAGDEESVTGRVIEERTSDDWVYTPLVATFGILIGLAIIIPIISRAIRRHCSKRHNLQQRSSRLPTDDNNDRGDDNGTGAFVASPSSSMISPIANSDLSKPMLLPSLSSVSRMTPHERLSSLDTFRGISLVLMVFVNYGGGGYWFFEHTAWNGLTVADLLFAWFIWIMGTSMAISFESQRKRLTPWPTIMYRIIRRTIILFALGVIVSNGVISTDTVRLPGVLQRFAFSFFIVAIILAFTPRRYQLFSLLISLTSSD
jgi:hypothetical protein